MMPSPVRFQIRTAGEGGFYLYDNVVRSRDGHVDIVAGLDPSGFNKYTCAHRCVSEMAGSIKRNGLSYRFDDRITILVSRTPFTDAYYTPMAARAQGQAAAGTKKGCAG